MRALELRTAATSTPVPPSSSLSLGSDLLHASFSASDSFLSPASALSISSSAASAGLDSPSANSERSSIKLRAKGSHYRAMAAAAEAAEVAQERKARSRGNSNDDDSVSNLSWSSNSQAPSGSSVSSHYEEHITLEPGLPATAGHTPRIGSQEQCKSVPKAVDHIVSMDSQLQASFMDKVLAQLRLSVSPTLDTGSPTFAQLLPAFDAVDELDKEDTVPPPPSHPRMSALTNNTKQKTASMGTSTHSINMEATMSAQSDRTLVEPGSASIAAVGPPKDVFSPLSMCSSSTMGHSSRPSDASTMTAASSTSSFSSVSSTKSIIQARQLRKELDLELRQMALDLEELRRRERNAMVYGISPQRRRRAGEISLRASMDFDDDLEDEDGSDMFEFDDGRLQVSAIDTSRSSAVPQPSGTQSIEDVKKPSHRRPGSYRWSKADRDLVARCISTCLTIAEDPRPDPPGLKKHASPPGMPVSTSCTKVWNGVQEVASVDQSGPGLEVDLAYFLDSEEDLLRPTYELPVGFLNQPLNSDGRYGASAQTQEKGASQQQSLHYSRSIPLFSSADGGIPISLDSDTAVEPPARAGTATYFEIMAGPMPLQLPARPAPSPKAPPKLRQTKSRNGLFNLALPGGGSSSSSQTRLRSASSTNALRSAALSRGQDERDTLARGPGAGSSSSRPSTPTAASQLKASSAALLAAAFNRSSPPRQTNQGANRVDSRPLPLPPLDTSPSYSYSYPHGQGIAHEPYGLGGTNKRLPVTPAGVGVGITRAKALDRLQGLLRRRIIAGSSALR